MRPYYYLDTNTLIISIVPFAEILWKGPDAKYASIKNPEPCTEVFLDGEYSTYEETIYVLLMEELFSSLKDAKTKRREILNDWRNHYQQLNKQRNQTPEPRSLTPR